ncbi:hypothetical protein WJX79_003320 [Trebouxia sp. C0005]
MVRGLVRKLVMGRPAVAYRANAFMPSLAAGGDEVRAHALRQLQHSTPSRSTVPDFCWAGGAAMSLPEILAKTAWIGRQCWDELN